MDDGHYGGASEAMSEEGSPSSSEEWWPSDSEDGSQSDNHPCESLRFDDIWQIKRQAGDSIIVGRHCDFWPYFPSLEKFARSCKVCETIAHDLSTIGFDLSTIALDKSSEASLLDHFGLPAEITYYLTYFSGLATQTLTAPRKASATSEESTLYLELCIEVKLEVASDKPGQRLKYDIRPVDDGLASWLRVEPLQPFLSAKNVHLIKSAIEDCQNHHERCRPRTSEAFVPTRLIDLGARGSGSVPRLVATAQDPNTKSKRKYATLSYCWGSPSEAASQLTTTKETLTQRFDGIPLSTMPSVVQDAVTVCRALDIRYLWVDALCIVQGDRADWAQESELMGKVYAHSYLTVCAASSNSCREPFLQRVHAKSEILAFRSETYPHFQSQPMLFQRCQNEEEAGGRWENIDGMRDCKWFERGWVIQERLLASRCLVLKDHLFISCSECRISETGKNIYNTKGEMTIVGVIDETKRILEQHSRPTWLAAKLWDDIVISSTASKLTNTTDRLPSLAGLAQQFGEAMAFLPSDYLAGLWIPFLPASLLWSLQDGKYKSITELLEATRSMKPPVAASWSPLPLDGACFKSISYTSTISVHGHTRTECKSIEGAATANGSNWYATSTGARLTVTARTVQVLLDLRDIPTDLTARRVSKDDRYAAYCFFDFEDTDSFALEGENILLLLLCSSCSGGSADLHDWGDGAKLDDEDDEDDDDDDDDDDNKVTLTENLRRVKSEYSQYAPEDLDYKIPPMEECLLCQSPGLNRRAWGLILHPAGEENVFFRVGMFMSRAREAGGTALFSGSPARTLEII